MKTPFKIDTTNGVRYDLACNWPELVAYAETEASPAMKSLGALSSREKAEWGGYANWTTAIEKAKTGDHELTAQVMKIGDQLPKTTAKLSRRRPTPDLAGHAPIVGAYLAGDPRAMLRFTPSPNRPIVRLGVNIGVSWTIEHRVIELRGAAILALTNALEASGYAVEIDLLDSNGGNGPDDPKNRFSVLVRLKSAAHYLDAGILAFSLLSVATHRRLVFSLMEQVENANHLRALTIPHGHGYPGDHPDTKTYDIQLTAAQIKYSGDFADEKKAAKWCQDWLDKITQGKEVTA